MRLLSVFHTFFVLYCICFFSSANCEEQLIQDGNGGHVSQKLENLLAPGPVITSEKLSATDSGASDMLLPILQRNLKKKLDEEASKNPDGSSNDEDAMTIFEAEISRAVNGGATPVRKLNRRSAEAAQTEKAAQSTPDSGSSSGKSGEDQHSGKLQADADTSKGAKEERAENSKDSSDNHAALIPFKNGPLEIVTEPIKKVLSFLLDKIRGGDPEQ